MNIELWQALKEKFTSLYERCKKIDGDADIAFIAPVIIDAGKYFKKFLEFCEKEQYDINGDLKNIPTFPLPIKNKTNSVADRYGSYWLWVLVWLGSKAHIEIVNPNLRNHFFRRMSVAELWSELPIDSHLIEKHISHHTGYIQDICLGSQQLCEFIIMQLYTNGQNLPNKTDELSQEIPHIELNLYTRILTVGFEEFKLTGSQWEFLAALASSRGKEPPLPCNVGPINFKTAKDSLRKDLKKKGIDVSLIVPPGHGGYILSNHVVVKKNSSVAIRKTYHKER